MANRKKRGDIDFDGALEDLISRYGTTERGTEDYESNSSSFESSAESQDFQDIHPQKGERKSRKGPKHSDMIANENNRPIIKVLTDMADEYFKHDDSKRASKFKFLLCKLIIILQKSLKFIIST